MRASSIPRALSAFIVATLLAVPGAIGQTLRQAGNSPIYSFDVMHEGTVVGEVTINAAKKTPSYVLRAEGLAPGMNYMFWYQGATAEDLYLLGYQGTSKLGRLSMSGTFPETSLLYTAS